MILRGWPDFIEAVQREKGNVDVKGIKTLLMTALEDKDMFIHRQGERLEFYLNQAASGAMSKSELKEYVTNVARLTELMIPDMEGEVRTSAELLYERVNKHLINGLLTVL